MRFTRVLTLLLSMVLLGPPVLVAAAGTASAADGWTTEAVVTKMPSQARYKSNIEIDAVLGMQDPSTQDWYSADGQTVHLQRQMVGEAGFTTIADLVTDADGKVAFYTPAVKNATYQVVYDGGTWTAPAPDTTVLTLAPTTSDPHGLGVARNLNDSSLVKSGRYFLRGNVDPGWGNQVIHLQKRTCRTCAWRNVDKQVTTSTGGWRFRITPPRRGTWSWRLYIGGSSDYLKSWSNKIYFIRAS